MYIASDIDRQAHSGIWVLADAYRGRLKPVAFELLGTARALAIARPQPVWAVVFGTELEGTIGPLWEYGADTVLLLDDPALARCADEDAGQTLLRLIRQYRPEIVLAGANATGRALVPRVAVQAHCGLTADCTELSIDHESGALLQTRPAFGGNLMATIRSDTCLPQMATVRPGVMRARERQPGRRGELIRESMLPGERSGLKTVLETIHDASASHQLGHATFVITGGRGMKGPEGFARLAQLAGLVGGSVGATRAAVDAGWVPYGMQIGQTGQTVQPKIYISFGVSGQIQHLVGMQNSDLVIAVNRDADAPIMQRADIAIVGDVFEVLEALIQELTPVSA
mgnify:CR=1 FL=1